MNAIVILNYEGPEGPVFYPRLRETLQEEGGMRSAGEDEAPELDMEYDCE